MRSYHLDDTIVAIASGPGGAARGILRLSGPNVVQVVAEKFQPHDGRPLDSVRRASVVPGELSIGGQSPLPVDLHLWPDERSYTRQPAAELHTIGSPPLLAAAVQVLCASGARLAEPGEFTLRAFLAGRIDLTQAEAVLGVIDAQDRRQFDAALLQLAGGLAAPLAELRDTLLDLLAELEAGLDFVEEDITLIDREELGRRLNEAAAAVQSLAEQMSARGDAADDPRVVLIGWPNVGKSSLFNALAPQSSALVSEVPGTTRDYLTARVELGGLTSLLFDTAGVERGELPGIREAAQRMTREQTQAAQLTVLCLDSTRAPHSWELSQLAVAPAGPRLIVLTKCDAPRASWWHDAWPAPGASNHSVPIETSAATGQGLSVLRERLREALTQSREQPGVVLATAARCGESLRLASAALAHAVTVNNDAAGEELIATEMRIALDELGKVAGAVYTDDLLDRIFNRFCIGK